MDYNNAFQISATGMALEKARLEVTANNLANMHVAARPGTSAYRPLSVLAATVPLNFDAALDAAAGGVRVAGIVPQDVAPRLAYEPGHPYADERGFVSYPGVDHTAEMVNMNTALRAYEANVVAMNAARVMAARTLDIGGQS